MRREKTPQNRLWLIRAGFFVFGALIIVQLFRVQILSHKFYAALASGQHDLYRTLFPERGSIYGMSRDAVDPSPLATNRKRNLAYAEPFRIKDPHEVALRLAPLLGMDAADLTDRMSSAKEQYHVLMRDVPDDVRAKIEDLKIDGIGFSEEDSRFYPEGATGAQTLGFVGAADGGGRAGRYGVEGYYEGKLSGEEGFLASEKDSLGRIIAAGAQELKPAQNGADIVLTIDRTVEYVVCKKLEDWVTQHGADRGTAVVLDPSTGAVIAMCDAPSFDPNDYGKAGDPAVYNNTAVFDAYEPGSVFKAITMAAGLDTGKITPESTFYDTGEEKLGPFTIRNSDLKAHGLVTMTDILTESLNTGIDDVARRVGPQAFLSYVQDFGFGKKTGIELQTEASGNVDALRRKGDIWTATGAFGQGLTVTALQLAAAYGAMADGGVLMKPTVVHEIRHPDGAVESEPPATVRRVMSEKAAKLLTAMLTEVVERGHGKRAAVKGYWIAGKTGTAQIPKQNGSGYETGTTIGTFAGFGPVEDPKFAMVVRIDRPKDVQFAESAAAPLWGDIAKFLLQYYEVPPTRN